MNRTLIAYYSRKGENYWNGSIKNLERGNTEIVAEMIADMTGGDLFEVDTVKTYPADYYDCIGEAKAELRNSDRPEIKAYVGNMDEYDTIFIGYPNWWGDMPMILYTFLDEYDLSGKTVAPFNTSGGSGFSGSLDTIAEMEPEAEITEGLSLGDGEAEDCADDVAEWLANIGMTEEADS